MTVKDPVCRKKIDPEDVAGASDYQGNPYYSCSEHCKKAFHKKPEKYMSLGYQHHGDHPLAHIVTRRGGQEWLTVFIPCGTTQAMEVLAITSGDPFIGALILFVFVLGTSPTF